MNKPTTSRELELRSDYDEVRCGGCNKGNKSWLAKRRRVKKQLHKAMRQAGKILIINA